MGVGTAVGAVIGAVGGFLFGGGRLLSKALTGAGKKVMTKVATNTTMKELAEKTVEQGITRAQRKFAVDFAAKATGIASKDVAKTALQSGRARALEAIGRGLVTANPALASAAKEWTADQFAAYAVKNATTKEIRKRTLFEASKWTAESFKDVADMTFLLDMDPEVSLRRVGVRGEEISKFEDRSFLEQVRSGYLALAEEFGFVRIDASKSAEDVADEVFERIQEVL